MNDACNRRDFFRESWKGVFGGLLSFGLASASVKSVQLSGDLHVDGDTLRDATFSCGAVHLHNGASVRDCRIETSGGTAIHVKGAQGVSISGCFIDHQQMGIKAEEA